MFSRTAAAVHLIGPSMLLGGAGLAFLAGYGAPVALLAGVGVALLGSVFAAVPPVLMMRRPVQDFPVAIMAGLGVRFLVTASAALALATRMGEERKLFLLVVGVAQFVVLGLDVVGLLRVARRVAGA